MDDGSEGRFSLVYNRRLNAEHVGRVAELEAELEARGEEEEEEEEEEGEEYQDGTQARKES